jgi:hypothetical protein
MAKKLAATSPAPSQPKPEERFVELMLVAADFVQSCGGLEPAKKALADAGKFVESAGSVESATRALEVLESLKQKIGT